VTSGTTNPEVAAEARPTKRRPRQTVRVRPDTLAWIALVVLLAAAARFLFVETRGTTFWFDEWMWVLGRPENDLDTFLEPHNGHLSLVPFAVYKLLLSGFGLDVYGPYRLIVIGAHLLCVLLVFIYASRRVGGFMGLLAATLILFLGPAWQDILWPFQIAWLVSIGGCVAALLMLDRGDRLGDFSASALLALSLASSGLGLAIAAGLAVDILWGRRRWRDGWIVAAPLALYGLWSLTFQDAEIFGTLAGGLGAIVDAAAASMSALLGLAGETVPGGAGSLLEWGRPLLAVATLLFVWRVVQLRRVPPRVLALLTILVTFWIATEWSRGPLATPYESRYLYVGALFLLLVAIELVRGVSPCRPVRLMLVAAVAAAAVSNIGVLRDGGEFIRQQGEITRAVLGTLEASRPLVKPRHVIGLPGVPFLAIRADSYFAVTREDGTPAATFAQIERGPWYARLAADRELIRILSVDLQRSSKDPTLGSRPAVDGVMEGRIAPRQSCIAFRAEDASSSRRARLDVVLPPEGVRIAAAGGPVGVSVRRVADTFEPIGRMAGSARAILRIPPDGLEQPWHVRAETTGRATICGLA
jgi:hypothetical protein